MGVVRSSATLFPLGSFGSMIKGRDPNVEQPPDVKMWTSRATSVVPYRVHGVLTQAI